MGLVADIFTLSLLLVMLHLFVLGGCFFPFTRWFNKKFIHNLCIVLRKLNSRLISVSCGFAFIKNIFWWPTSSFRSPQKKTHHKGYLEFFSSKVNVIVILQCSSSFEFISYFVNVYYYFIFCPINSFSHLFLFPARVCFFWNQILHRRGGDCRFLSNC